MFVSKMVLAAVVAGISTCAGAVADDRSTELSATCAHMPFTTLNGMIVFTIAGEATSSATTPADLPGSTRVICTLTSPQQPGNPDSAATLEWTLDSTAPGLAVSTLTDVDTVPTTSPWPARPARICATAIAYGLGLDPVKLAETTSCSNTTIAQTG